jgi:hypothetical protein
LGSGGWQFLLAKFSHSCQHPFADAHHSSFDYLDDSPCDHRIERMQPLEFEKMFNREAVLAKTCEMDRAVSTAPLRVYRFKDQLWFKDNSVRRPVAAGIDQVCDVLDIDARRSSRNNCGRC